MKRLATLLLLAASPFATAQETTLPKSPAQEASLLRRTAFGTADSLRTDAATDAGLLERLRNMPNLEVGAAAWILAGGTHHTSFSYDLTVEYWEDFAEMAGIEMVVIDENTTISEFKKELRMNEVYYMLNKALC